MIGEASLEGEEKNEEIGSVQTVSRMAWKINSVDEIRAEAGGIGSTRCYACACCNPKDEEFIGEVGEVLETFEVTINSGASKSVWPGKNKGVERRPLREKVKNVAANGTQIALKAIPFWSSRHMATIVR